MPLKYKPRGKPRITAFKEFRLNGGEVIGVFKVLMVGDQSWTYL